MTVSDSSAGCTAHWIAAVRAVESAKSAPLFVDRYAEALSGDVGKAFKARSEAATGGENLFIVVRTKYFDDFIEQSAVAGSQIALLGAGFDTRAYRLNIANVRVFELDRADVLSAKTLVLASEKTANGNDVVRIDADLRDHWIAELLNAGFNPKVRTVWVLEGLLFYLSGSIVHQLMQDIEELSASSSSLIFDVSGTGLLDLSSMAAFVESRRNSGREVPFCTDRPESVFANPGNWEIVIDYCGSKTASFGRVPEYAQDLTQGKRAKLNSYFVKGKRK